MTFLIATPATIASPTFTYVPMATPPIADGANVNSAPWLHSALTQLRDLENSGELIPGIGDLRIPVETGMRVRLMLSGVGIKLLPSPVVAPVSGGGVSVVWSLGLKEVKFDFDPNGGVTFFKIEDDEIADDGQVLAFADGSVTRQLHWMLDSQS